MIEEKPARDAGFRALEGAVVKVQGNRDGDAELFEHPVDHADNGLVAAHILAGAFRNAEDNRRLELLGGEKDGFGPFQVVDVELADGIMAFTGLVQHILCRNEHEKNLHFLVPPARGGRPASAGVYFYYTVAP